MVLLPELGSICPLSPFASMFDISELNRMDSDGFEEDDCPLVGLYVQETVPESGHCTGPAGTHRHRRPQGNRGQWALALAGCRLEL